MFEDFSFEPGQRYRPRQTFYDPKDTFGIGLDEYEDGTVSPTDSSSRGSSPSLWDYPLYNKNAPTSAPGIECANNARQMSISELSQHFTRQTLQPGPRPSAPAPTTSVPLMLRAHDPTNLAILNTTHARRISRRRPSTQQKVPCSAAHLDRMTSFVEQYLDDGAISCGPSRRRSGAREVDFEDPDDDFHPSMLLEEDSASSTPSPIDGPRPGFDYFDLSSDPVLPTPPLPGDVARALSRKNSLDKALKPVRVRRRTLTKSRLSIGTK